MESYHIHIHIYTYTYSHYIARVPTSGLPGMAANLANIALTPTASSAETAITSSGVTEVLSALLIVEATYVLAL